MTDFARWLQGRTRGLGIAAAMVGAALFLAGGKAITEAQARTARSDLALGPAGAGSGAEGRLQFKQKRRGERLKIRLDNLQPRTDYEVRDGATNDLLGTVRTNRRGSARKTLRASGSDSFSGIQLQICEPGSDVPVLEGEVPSDGFPNGSYRIGTVSTDPDAAVQVSITLSSTTAYAWSGGDPAGDGGGGNGGDGTVDGPWKTREGGGEGTYESISLFAGPGGVWTMDGADNGFVPEFPSIPGPVTFWIADGENGLVQVATIEKNDWGKPIPLPMPGSGGGMNFMGGDRPVDGGGNDGGGWDFPQPDNYSWYADNLTDPGLPLGVAGVADLSGRAFEVRDGEGNVLLEGVLPELEEIIIDPLPEPMPWPDGTCPGGGFTINIDINVDLSGIDWSSIDWSSFDFSTFDWNSLDLGALLGGDGTCFDFSKAFSGFKF